MIIRFSTNGVAMAAVVRALDLRITRLENTECNHAGEREKIHRELEHLRAAVKGMSEAMDEATAQ